jgi:hypothetical protein
MADSVAVRGSEEDLVGNSGTEHGAVSGGRGRYTARQLYSGSHVDEVMDWSPP